MAFNSYPVLLRLISSSVAIANGAGRIIREVMNKGELGIIEKGVNDPQTEADRRAQHCIISNLSRQFPSLKIIGEEDAYLSGKEQDDQRSNYSMIAILLLQPVGISFCCL